MGGGIGTRRGPGETKMEVDRRRIRRRITRLHRDLEEMAKTRDVKRRGREQAGLPGVALAGYTNAGKSTLLNRLSGAGVLVEDKLFSTLDPTTRRLDLPAGRSVTLTDTVGFIAKLPHDLVEAFKSTLEEVALADLVVHLVDAAQSDPVAQVEAVRKVLTEVGAGDVPELLVLNKGDLVDDLSRARLMRQFPGAPLISAATGEGIDELLIEVAARLPHPDVYLTAVLPFQRGDLLDRAYREGEVLEVEHRPSRSRCRPPRWRRRCHPNRRRPAALPPHRFPTASRRPGMRLTSPRPRSPWPDLPAHVDRHAIGTGIAIGSGIGIGTPIGMAIPTALVPAPEGDRSQGPLSAGLTGVVVGATDGVARRPPSPGRTPRPRRSGRRSGSPA